MHCLSFSSWSWGVLGHDTAVLSCQMWPGLNIHMHQQGLYGASGGLIMVYNYVDISKGSLEPLDGNGWP